MGAPEERGVPGQPNQQQKVYSQIFVSCDVVCIDQRQCRIAVDGYAGAQGRGLVMCGGGSSLTVCQVLKIITSKKNGGKQTLFKLALLPVQFHKRCKSNNGYTQTQTKKNQSPAPYCLPLDHIAQKKLASRARAKMAEYPKIFLVISGPGKTFSARLKVWKMKSVQMLTPSNSEIFL